MGTSRASPPALIVANRHMPTRQCPERAEWLTVYGVFAPYTPSVIRRLVPRTKAGPDACHPVRGIFTVYRVLPRYSPAIMRGRDPRIPPGTGRRHPAPGALTVYGVLQDMWTDRLTWIWFGGGVKGIPPCYPNSVPAPIDMMALKPPD